MSRLLVSLLFLCPAAFAVVTAADTAKQLQEAGLDPSECYRVIEQKYSKEDVRIYFTSGYMIFARPVNGVRAAVVFTTDVEAGDGEVLVLPPVRSERLSLVNFIDSPNLDEHFRSALLLVTDNTAEDLLAMLRENGAKKVPEMGALLAEQWSPVVKNLNSTVQVRQVEDILSGQPKSGLFHMSVAGTKQGNFDVICDPAAEENILVGQQGERSGRTYFNVWTSFQSRARMKAAAEGHHLDLAVDNYRIDATLDPDLQLKATTRFTGTPVRPGRAFGFIISQRMRVLEAHVDGQPAEVFQRDSPRATVMRDSEDQEFLVVAPTELEAGKPHEYEIRHEGGVVAKAGEQIYYVGSRSTWYPRKGTTFARYELTFRYPKDLGFVATGDVVKDKVEGEWRVTERKTDVPIRFAAFNLGDYKSVTITHDPYRIEVFANRSLEAGLRPRPLPALDPDMAKWTPHRTPDAIDPAAGPADAPVMSHLEFLARDVAGAFEYMTAQFGPPPLKTLTVSPIPGGFGQGFPGLLYLSTLAYLDPSQRPATAQDRFVNTFFSDLLDAHEVAHQWWGNLVTGQGYQDVWLTEALANYSALLYVEKKKGAHAMDTVLDDFRTHLLELGPNGRTLEAAGPITWGYRLESSQSPEAWHHIMYEKGAWVMHMLRRRMGDDRFLAMLRALSQRYQYKAINTEQFRLLAAEFMPPHGTDSSLQSFFDTWVYGTGIPAVKLSSSSNGVKVTGTLTQSGVPNDFSASVPVEVQVGRQRTVYWVVTSSDEPVPFSFPVKGPNAKVALDTRDGLFTVKN